MSFVPFTPDEQVVIEAYLNNLPLDVSIAAACDRLGMPEPHGILRTAVATGVILVQTIQGRLPNYGSVRNGEVRLGRNQRTREGEASLALIPQHLFTLNWADSAPGISWPEAYHAVHLPGYERWVIVASRDGDDAWGCTDNAIGHFPNGKDLISAAGEVIKASWRALIGNHDQGAWQYVLEQALVKRELAEAWRLKTWDEADVVEEDEFGNEIPPSPPDPDIQCYWLNSRDSTEVRDRVVSRPSPELAARWKGVLDRINERLSASGPPVKVVKGSDSKEYKVTFPQGRRPPTNRGGE